MKIRKKRKGDLHKRESPLHGKVLNNRAPRRINMTDKKRAQSGKRQKDSWRKEGIREKKMSAPFSTMHNSCNVQAGRRHCFAGNFKVWREQGTTVEQLSDRLLPRTEGLWDFCYQRGSEVRFSHVSKQLRTLWKPHETFKMHLLNLFEISISLTKIKI